ncbi:unnamed protein product [Dovyalis caffra]|uniref:Prolamin-like domain-containing protein n=1 Tax=Dovyalis caffra TaxID=77055 RepID=A0AAV1R7B5_9ROSI|nr:unnamed protein product [Dovyalis caffra]
MLSGKRSHQKRGREAEESITSILAMEVREVAKAIHALTKNEGDIDELYDVVMTIIDFDDDILNNVFDYLVQNERLTKAFMAEPGLYNYVDQCAFVAGQKCGEEILYGSFLGKPVTLECRQKLVLLGKACDDSLIKVVLEFPEFKKHEEEAWQGAINSGKNVP